MFIMFILFLLRVQWITDKLRVVVGLPVFVRNKWSRLKQRSFVLAGFRQAESKIKPSLFWALNFTGGMIKQVQQERNS